MLETALQDHRFGSAKAESKGEETKPSPARTGEAAFPQTWEAPRYEASPVEVLPSVNRLHELESEAVPTDVSSDSPSEALAQEGAVAKEESVGEDSWKEWFERFDNVAKATVPAVAAPEMPESEEKEVAPTFTVGAPTESVGEDQAVNVPIHAVYQPLSAELLPRIAKETSREPVTLAREEPDVPAREPRGRRSSFRALQAMMVIVTLVSVAIAVLGTGYLDSYVILDSRVSALAGIVYYNR